MAKYIFLQYMDESKAPRPGTPEMQQTIDAFASYLDELKAAGTFHDGDPCQPSAAAFSVHPSSTTRRANSRLPLQLRAALA